MLVYALFATFFSLLQFLNIKNLLLKALLLELTQLLTMMSHWLFAWQYYSSSLDIEKMLSTRLPSRTKLSPKFNQAMLYSIAAGTIATLIYSIVLIESGRVVDTENEARNLLIVEGCFTTIMQMISLGVLSMALVRVRLIISC